MKNIFIVSLLLVLPLFVTVQAQSSSEADSLFNEGVSYLNEDPYLGIRLLTEAYNIEDNPMYVFYRAVAKAHVQDQRGAVSDYTKVIEDNSAPENMRIMSHTNRGELRFDIENYSGSVSDFTEVIELMKTLSEDKHSNVRKKDLEAYGQRGMAKYVLGDYRGALTDIKSHLDLFPVEEYRNSEELFIDVVGLYAIKGVIIIELGNVDEGCHILSRAGELGYKPAYDSIIEYCNN